MSSNASGTTSSSLQPAWRSGHQGGRGFQPPPAVPADDNEEDTTTTETPKRSSSNRNSFSLLSETEDEGPPRPTGKTNEDGSGSSSSKPSRQRSAPFPNRSEGLRSTGGERNYPSRQSSMKSLKGAGSGRSLAELASRVPSSRSHAPNHRGGNAYEDGGGGSNTRLSSGLRGGDNRTDETKVIRYNREKLLSMRSKTGVCPRSLKHMEGSPLLSQDVLDPVCWDNFNADAIWAQTTGASRERRAASGHAATGKGGPPGTMRALSAGRRRTDGNDGGKWRRGVALPPAEARGTGGGGGRGRYEDAETPEDLWDDPVENETAAAADFSAFGGSLDENPIRSRSCSMGSDGFDLSNMSEAARKFEEDLHGTNGTGPDDEAANNHAVDPQRPLAEAGTTVKSGSGDNVNVFEDFGAVDEEQAIKSGDEQTASSRLMQMIGVTTEASKEESDVKPVDDWDKATSSRSDAGVGDQTEAVTKEIDTSASSNIFSGFSSTVPRNPWGEPAVPSTGGAEKESSGVDLASRLKAVTVEQTEQERLQREESEVIRRRQEDEKRQVALLAQQQQAEAQARQQALQTRPQPQQLNQNHNQLELILIERISTILENAWGRSNLITILQTLHNEDSRVMQLLGSVDALRALINRHARRIALAKDASFPGTEIAVLVMTNAQWQQHQAAEVQRVQQEEQQKIIAAQQEAAARAKAEAEAELLARQAESESVVITNDPWYYADPQGNVQGPFGGEEMRQWLEAGYFKGDLPISQNPQGSFRPLSSLFTDLTIAFKPAAPSEEEMAMITATEAMQVKANEEAAKAMQAKEEAERAEMEKAKAEADARNAAEKERLIREASIEIGSVSDSKDNQQNVPKRAQNNAAKSKKQSDQLKMLLGLGGSAGNQSSVDISSHKGATIAGPSTTKGKESRQAKSTNEIADPQPQNKSTKAKSFKKAASAVTTPQLEKTATPGPGPGPVPAPTSAWGGAGAGKISLKKKSMSEIQREEAKIAAVLAKQRGTVSQSTSGGWANIAASGGTGAWSGTTVIASPAPVSASTLAPVSNGTATVQSTSSKQHAITTNTVKQQTMNRSSTQQIMEEFGANGKMSPMLESWCKDQMRKLSGSEDLTLIAYCMTLSDPIEIKQYITTYLGSTPQINNFASEFINRKNGNPKQEQWETTAKKGRKKKSVVNSK